MNIVDLGRKLGWSTKTILFMDGYRAKCNRELVVERRARMRWLRAPGHALRRGTGSIGAR